MQLSKQVLVLYSVFDALSEGGVTLKQVGKNCLTNCLFHDDNNPSMLVSKDRYTCLACGARGSSIDLYAHFHNLTWTESCRTLGKRLNLVQEGHTLNDLLQEGMTELHLAKAEALGFTPQLVSTFQLGIFQYHNVAESLFGNYPAPYLDRLTLPLRDDAGQVVAYQCRSLDGREPKYLNSLNTDKFTKSDYLFDSQNYQLPYRHRELMIVEGVKDAMVTALAGYRSLSTLGASVSQSQVFKLMKVVQYWDKGDVFLCFDNDAAGFKATYQLLSKLSYSARRKVKVLHTYHFKDPAEAVAALGSGGVSAMKLTAVDAYLWLRSYRPTSPLIAVQRGFGQVNPWFREMKLISSRGGMPRSTNLLSWAFGNEGTGRSLTTVRFRIVQARVVALGQYMHALAGQSHYHVPLLRFCQQFWRSYQLIFNKAVTNA